MPGRRRDPGKGRSGGDPVPSSHPAPAAGAPSTSDGADPGLPRREHDRHSEADGSCRLGEAALHLGRAGEAGAQFASARAIFEADGDDARVLECAGWQTTALLAQEEPTALAVAEDALRRASALPALPDGAKARLLWLKGEVLLEHHEWGGATRCLRGALRALGHVIDLVWLSQLYRDLALLKSTLGDSAGGRAYAARSRLLPPAAWPADAARANTTLGIALLRSGATDEAEPILRTAVRITEEHALGTARAASVLGLAELAWVRGQLAQASALAHDAAANARASHARFSLADAHLWLARVEAARGKAGEAASLFHAALEILDELGVMGRRLECHAELARAFEERGHLHEAVKHWKAAVGLARSGSGTGHASLNYAPGPTWLAALMFTRSDGP